MAHENSLSLFLVFNVLSLPLAHSVPIVTWWHGHSLSFHHGTSQILSGHTLELSDVMSKYLRPIGKESNVVLMFLQDQMSIDDFTKYPDSFPFLKQRLEKGNQLVLPSVSQDKGTLYESMEGNSHFKINVVFPETDWISKLAKENLDDSKINVFVLRLEPVGDVKSSLKDLVFKRNDRTIETVIQKFVEKMDQFSVIYTATEESQDVAKVLLDEQLEDDQTLNGRHILAKEESNDMLLFNGTNILMVLRGLKFGQTQGDLEDLWLNKTKASLKSANVIALDVASGDAALNIEITLRNDTYEWSCSSIFAKGNFNKTNVNATFDCSDRAVDPQLQKNRVFSADSTNVISAPTQYSFACYKLLFVNNNVTNGSFYLQLDQLQLQPKDGITKFSGAYNCVGFFTLPILSGLFVAFLLIASLFMGVMMTMNIQTQDRFDDPKGKTITVAVGE